MLEGLASTLYMEDMQAALEAHGVALEMGAVAYWLGGYVLSLLGYQMLGLFPGGMLVLWGTVGLVELVLAALLGGWIYREGPMAELGTAPESAG